jgi:GT2 family glycosyltransferase
MARLSYAVITPARNEAEHLRRLADALAAQTAQPAEWVIVDNGSTDATPATAAAISSELDFARAVTTPLHEDVARGAPVVRAFHAGLEATDRAADVVVKLDADISFAPDFFARLLARFTDDAELGIVGATCYECDDDGIWRQRHSNGLGIRGACRAYRRECLEAVLPLEERMGWDTLDLVKARVRGWRTAVSEDLPFLHHRPEGARERTEIARWVAQGEACHYMGYRLSYLVLRTAYKVMRHPAAAALLSGYLRAWLRKSPRCADEGVIEYVRRQQSLRRLPERVREACRARAALSGDQLPVTR